MNKKFSPAWKGSTQPRKQRKFRRNAPLHVRHHFLAAHLSEDLRRETGRRALPLRKGDEVRVLRGSKRGLTGVIDMIDLRNARVTIDSMKVKKVDGSEVLKPISPSNLLVTKLSMDDKKRKAIIERKRGMKVSEERTAKKKPEKKEEKSEKREKPDQKDQTKVEKTESPKKEESTQPKKEEPAQKPESKDVKQ